MSQHDVLSTLRTMDADHTFRRDDRPVTFVQLVGGAEDHLALGTAVTWTLAGAGVAGMLLALLAVPMVCFKGNNSSKEASESDALLAEKGALNSGSLSDADTASCDT
eukprot:TRINITY_DN112509_c0_g1_i1.p3 TRINITY_DN112509_c0_g1~~TRINITY_DN112509_c0_g1_i1.p3  ORF type:complete len:107 (+),score=17.99 TRINITY_DN112509_c0_g1_i1:179-499(+)